MAISAYRNGRLRAIKPGTHGPSLSASGERRASVIALNFEDVVAWVGRVRWANGQRHTGFVGFVGATGGGGGRRVPGLRK